MKKRLFIVLLMAWMLTVFAGCNFEIDDSEFRADTQQMLDAVLVNDMDTCRALISRDVDDAALAAGVAQMQTVLEDVAEYTLQPISFNKKATNGITQTTIRYRMSAGEMIFLVDAVRVSNADQLAGFHVVRYEEPVYTGTVGHMDGADAAQWILLLVAAAETAFVIWMLIDCFRHTIGNKALWIALILIGNALITLTTGNGQFNLNYAVGTVWNHTALIRYSTGSDVLRLFLPVGAIVYTVMRKKLIQSEETAV